MKTLFNIIFFIVAIVLLSLIISLMPISKIGSFAVELAKKNGIALSAKNGWNLRLISLKGATSKINYSIDLNKTRISGFGENFTYGLINKDIYFEKLLVEVHLDKNSTITDIVDDLKQYLSKQHYTFEVKNLIIDFYKKNENDQENQNDELIFSDVKISKHENFKAFMANIAISKNKQNAILFTISNAGTKKYELNAKIEDDDFYCYIYDSFNEGNINCLSHNILETVHNIIGKKIENEFFKMLLDKRVSLKADIIHANNNKLSDFKINGKLMINNDYGDIGYNSMENIVNIKFDNIDLNKTTEDVRDVFQEAIEHEQRSQAVAMSGKENRILSNSKKKDNSENTNTFGKIIFYLVELNKDIEFTTNINVNRAIVGLIPVENFFFNVSKKTNGKFKLNEVSALFGENLNGKFLIKDSNDKIENLSISGQNINDLIKIKNLKTLNSNVNSSNYSINGYIDLSINSISMKNVSCSLNGVKIFIYDLLKTYNFFEKNAFSDEKIIVQNININEQFDVIINIMRKIYKAFNDFQLQEKQDAIFWKSLFEKRNQEQNSVINKFAFVVNNSFFYDKKINYFIFELDDSKKNTELNIISDGEIMNGKFYFNSKNIDDKETLMSKIQIKNLDLNFNEAFFRDIELATNRKFFEIFYENKDYNIPSLLGLNGFFEVSIDNFKINNKIYKNIAGKIDIRDGILSTEEFKFNFKNGKINSNAILSLQGRPELQMAFSGSNLSIRDLINSPINGIISFQCRLKAFGFNPVKFIQTVNGNGNIIVQNIKIPKFDLLHMSSESITNGLRLDYDYKSVIESDSLSFPYGEGNILIENGMFSGDLSLSRELVSGSMIFEYNIVENILRQISGSFAVLIAKKRLSTPFPIYIPFACNGKPEQPECLVNWEQLDDILNNFYQSV